MSVQVLSQYSTKTRRREESTTKEGKEANALWKSVAYYLRRSVEDSWRQKEGEFFMIKKRRVKSSSQMWGPVHIVAGGTMKKQCVIFDLRLYDDGTSRNMGDRDRKTMRERFFVNKHS